MHIDRDICAGATANHTAVIDLCLWCSARLHAAWANVRFGDYLIGPSTTALVKVFGRRPSQIEGRARAGVRKPPKHEPAGHRCDVMGI